LKKKWELEHPSMVSMVKLWFIHTRKYYPAMKRNELLIRAT
jgi:hypothetical protein